MPELSNHSSDDSFEAPARLVSALKNLRTDDVFIPITIDEAVLKAARRHLAQPAKPRVAWGRFRLWAGAVALILAVALVTRLVVKQPASLTRESILADLNHDGHVDILDAFELARRLKSGSVSDQTLDFNGDGVVNEQDIATIAARAVSLEKGRHS